MAEGPNPHLERHMHFVNVFVVALIALAIPMTIIVSTRSQEIRQRAEMIAPTEIPSPTPTPYVSNGGIPTPTLYNFK